MTAHREKIKAYLGEITLQNKSIVDWGAGSKPVSRYIKHDNCEFFQIDKNDYNHQDLIADIGVPIKLNKEYDYAFCMEVLEHVEWPDKLLENIYNNLKDGGTFIMSVPISFVVHADDDYWRFTPNGIALLLNRNKFKDLDLTMISTTDSVGCIVRCIK